MATASDFAHLLAGCDEAQRFAITSEAAPLLLRAGAGSGKTRVLTRRVAWRIANGDATASHVLVATFTRKAASELRKRLSALGAAGPLTAGTLHALALAELRRLALDRSRPLPVVLERRARLLERLAGRPANKARRGTEIAEIAAEIDWAKARLVDPEHYVEAARAAHRTTGLSASAVADAFANYEVEKHRRGLLDFDDLLVQLAHEIADDPDLAAAQRWRFRHFFIDEVQDMSAAQLSLVDAWLGGREDLFAVGDADQAIYGWGGALDNAFAELQRRYPTATVLELKANYRSSPQIVAVAGALRDTAHQAIACADEGLLPTVQEFASAEQEAHEVGAALLALRQRGFAYRDCAVLARTNAQLRLLGEALAHSGVPTRTSLGAFLADPEVRAILRQLRAARSAEGFAGALEGLGHGQSERSVVLDQLLELGAEYLLVDPLPSGEGFATYLRQSLGTEPGPGEGDGVDLLSFHRAKGLEWPVVFVTGLEDGLVPIAHARTAAARAEESRLLYVALSRASRELHCSWAKSRIFGDVPRDRKRSPLLEEPLRVLASLAPTLPPRAAAARAIAESRAHLQRGLVVRAGAAEVAESSPRSAQP